MLTKLPIRYVIDYLGTVAAAKGVAQANFQNLLDLVRRNEKC